MSFFDSQDEFSARFNQSDSHWAIDVYSPPEAGYLRALTYACNIQTRGYQLGEISKAARTAFGETFGGQHRKNDVAVYFCPTGTSANALTRFSLLDQNKSMVVYSSLSHSVDREAGAVESLTGSRALKPEDLFQADELADLKKGHGGYIPAEAFEKALADREYYYLNQKPHLFSMSVPSEDGSIPPIEYIKEMTDFTRRNDMLFHMDGARLFVAAAAQEKTLKEMTTDCGVDVLSLGGSKVGMVGAESVVFTPNFFDKYPHLHSYKDAGTTFDRMRSNLKRIGGLSGRSEEVSAQFLRALTDDYGLKVGMKAHLAACALSERVKDVQGILEEKPVQTNVVLLRMKKGAAAVVTKDYPYLKDMPVKEKDQAVIRFMASHATEPHHIKEAVAVLTKAGAQCPL
jgi:threonine aldolase